MTVLNIVK